MFTETGFEYFSGRYFISANAILLILLSVVIIFVSIFLLFLIFAYMWLKFKKGKKR